MGVACFPSSCMLGALGVGQRAAEELKLERKGEASL